MLAVYLADAQLLHCLRLELWTVVVFILNFHHNPIMTLNRQKTEDQFPAVMSSPRPKLTHLHDVIFIAGQLGLQHRALDLSDTCELVTLVERGQEVNQLNPGWSCCGCHLSIQDPGGGCVESDGSTLQVEPVGVPSHQAQPHPAASRFSSDGEVGDELPRGAVLSDRGQDVGATQAQAS